MLYAKAGIVELGRFDAIGLNKIHSPKARSQLMSRYRVLTPAEL